MISSSSASSHDLHTKRPFAQVFSHEEYPLAENFFCMSDRKIADEIHKIMQNDDRHYASLFYQVWNTQDRTLQERNALLNKMAGALLLPFEDVFLGGIVEGEFGENMFELEKLAEKMNWKGGS